MIGLSEHIDLALIALYLFWVFFFGLLAYLNRESIREGFPAYSDTGGRSLGAPGLLGMPRSKTFKLHDGTEVKMPPAKPEPLEQPKAVRVAPFGGAPLVPKGDPMLAEFGPGAYANRLDEVLLMHNGKPKIQPLRDLPDFHIVKQDRDPRGLPVIAADGKQAGEVTDVWIDVEEQMIRYLEISTNGRNVLVPMTMARVGGRLANFGVWRPYVTVKSLMSKHFENVPTTKNPNTVTLLEEDKITAYYGAGTFYATAARNEPLI